MVVIVPTWVIDAAGMIDDVVQSARLNVAAPTDAGVHWKVRFPLTSAPVAGSCATPLMVGTTVQVACPTRFGATLVTVTVCGTPTGPPKPVTCACAGALASPMPAMLIAAIAVIAYEGAAEAAN